MAMDLNQILRLAQRLFLRRLINKGIGAGIDYAARRGKAPGDMTPEDHAQARKGREMARRARQVARLTRRIGK